MDQEALVAAILTAGMLIRMPGTSVVSGNPEADRAGRAAEAVECYCAVVRALQVATRSGGVGAGAR